MEVEGEKIVREDEGEGEGVMFFACFCALIRTATISIHIEILLTVVFNCKGLKGLRFKVKIKVKVNNTI